MREAAEALGADLPDLRRLAPLPHMLERGRLAKRYPPGIREKVKAWCAVAAPITEAPSVETRERLLGVVGLHEGESELFGLLFKNPGYRLLSNDKVAMRALRADPDLTDVYESLCGRVACAELVLAELLESLGIESLATALAPLRPHNSMLNAIFFHGRGDHGGELPRGPVVVFTRDGPRSRSRLPARPQGTATEDRLALMASRP